MNRDFGKHESGFAMARNADSLQNNVNNYMAWNLSVFPIQNNKTILDLGCGPGMYFHQIMQYSPTFYVGADYDEKFLTQISELYTGYSNCSTIQLDLMKPEVPDELKKSKFDYTLFLDVLEHIENQQKAMKNVYKIMEETDSKYLFLRVPALQFIYGKNDEVIGHYRRYSKKPLKKLLESCSFNIELMHYHNIIGILPWYIIGNVLNRSLAVSNDEGKVFNFFVPALKFMEKIIHPPLGLSLYCICTRK